MSKACTKCHVVKPLDAFGKDPNHADGRQSWCKACKSQAKTERQKRNPEKHAREVAAVRAGIRKDKCAVCSVAIEGTGLCPDCRDSVEILGGVEGLQRAIRAVRYLNQQ